MRKTDVIRNGTIVAHAVLYNLWNMVPRFIFKQTQMETVMTILRADPPTVLLENGSMVHNQTNTDLVKANLLYMHYINKKVVEFLIEIPLVSGQLSTFIISTGYSSVAGV